MNAIDAPSIGLTGEEIIEDIAQQIAAELSKSCFLSRLCSYRSYSAKVHASLWLADFDMVEVPMQLTIGTPSADQPTVSSEMTIPSAAPSMVRERSGLDAPSLEANKTKQSTTAQKRIYVSLRGKKGFNANR